MIPDTINIPRAGFGRPPLTLQSVTLLGLVCILTAYPVGAVKGQTPRSGKAPTSTRANAPKASPLSMNRVLIPATRPVYYQRPDTGAPIGVYYYPEHWPRSQWKRDIDQIAALGFTFTHYAEFAWSRLEPTPGRYDFEWLDEAIRLAGQAGLKVILCTPSPTPPTWLLRQSPDMAVVNAKGRTLEVGNRLHFSLAHTGYREACRRINEAMARRYGAHPTVIGWQIGNEPHVEGHRDYSQASVRAFRDWLKQRYGTIEALNQAWGTPFWSQTYQTFDQILPPNSEAGATNHHAELDFDRFMAWINADFLNEQVSTLRPHTGGKFITTNYAYYKFLPEINPFLTRPTLDFTTYTFYPLSTYLGSPEGPLAYRLGSGLDMAYTGELTRSVHGRAGIMELQPGQINWGSFNALPLPGAVRMWMWHNLGMGADFICTYRYRQPTYGGEQYHQGIMEPDGVTLSPGGREYVQVINEYKQVAGRLSDTARPPAEAAGRATAILYHPDDWLDQNHQPHNRAYSWWEVMMNYYGAVRSTGAEATFFVRGTMPDPARHPVAVAPACQLLHEGTLPAWERYVRSGGHLIISARTAQKDSSSHLLESRIGAALSPLIGADIEGIDQLPKTRTGEIEALGARYPYQVWAELLIPRTALGDSLQVLARYASEFYAGKAAAVRRRLGRGTVTYIGAIGQGGELEKALVRDTYRQAGRTTLDLKPYVMVHWARGWYTAVNYTFEPVRLSTMGCRLNERLIGDDVLPPGGVTVFR